MSGRFPDAEDTDAFWDVLGQGLDVHKSVPPQHWDAETHVDLTGKGKNTSATPYGCWLNNPQAFDAKFFNITPREAPQVDPAQRLALLTAYEAIERAGIVPDATPSTRRDRVGVFYGVTSNDWMETNSAQNIDTYFIPGGNRAFIPGRINYFFKFSGPSAAIDTACSSSLCGIHMACNSLWQGDIDCAIAGGTNVLTNPDFTAGLDRGHFLSRTGNCHTFDDAADGYCRGEGVGTIILKRLEDAMADKDPILGTIRGAYTNHSAEAESITRPHVGAQRAIFNRILRSSRLNPYDVSYVEMHGTGTQVGDASEMSSVLETFAPDQATKYRRDDQQLYIGSAKANIGHGEAASGVSSLIKVLLMMQKDSIPPHCGIKTKINHKFPTNLSERNVKIADALTPWKKPDGGLRRAFVNNFSAAGGNSAILMEDAPPVPELQSTDARSTHVVAVSAKNATSLAANVKSMISFLGSQSASDKLLSQLSYTTTARRIHHQHRVMVSGADIGSITTKLQKALDDGDGSARPKSRVKVAFTFTGQGSQYPGMGKELYNNFSSFQVDIDRYNFIAQSLGFPSIIEIFTASGGDIDEYTPVVVQLATTCLQMALARLWSLFGIEPTSVVGHSLGEFAALNVAGVLSESDTIYLTGIRAQLLQEQCKRNTHSMLAVRSSAAKADSVLTDHTYEVACVNGPDDVVLSGQNEDIKEAQKTLSSEKIKATLLKVPYAFHSSQVDPILSDFEVACEKVTFYKPTIPILSPLEGEVVEAAESFSPSYLAKHCREPVDMLSAVAAAKDKKVMSESTAFIEIGPQPVVAGMMKTILGDKVLGLPSLQRGKDTWAVLTETLSSLYKAGAEINWAEYHRDFSASHKVLLLPSYNWDLKDYWIQYVNDWSLRKGDPVDAGAAQSKAIAAAEPEQPKVPKLESTTVHRVVEEKIDDKKGTITVEADIAREDLNPMVQGHRVNDVPLCTPSVYADMALTVGKYLLARYKPNDKKFLNIAAMNITAPLVAKPPGPQLIRLACDIDWAKDKASCKLISVDSTGKTTTQHATCDICFMEPKKPSGSDNTEKEALSRIGELRGSLSSGESYRFSKSMIYKMVAQLADFDVNYRAMSEIVLDSDKLEATGKCDFSGVKEGGTFHTHPAYIDALSQIGGFVMNANDKSDVNVKIFVNHGWESFEMYEDLDTAKEYTTHVRMSAEPQEMWGGDVEILDGDRLVGRFGNIKLQGVPRRLMNMILAKAIGKSSAPPKAPAKAPAKPAAQAAPKTAPATSGPTPVAAEAAPQKSAPAKAKKTVKKEPKAPKSSEKHTKALEIIAEESGLSPEDLSDDAVLADMGIDSLMAMIIAQRLDDEIGIPIEGPQFSELPTVADVKSFITSTSGESADTEEPAEEPEEEEVEDEAEEVVEAAPEETPVAKSEKPQAKPEPEVKAPAKTGAKPSPAKADFSKELAIISEETGVGIEELDDDSSFTEMGVDSLLQMIISTRLADELGHEIEANSFFEDVLTVKDLKNVLAPGNSGAVDDPPSSSASEVESEDDDADTPPSSAASDAEDNDKPSEEKPIARKKEGAPIRKASSILLQGRPQAGKPTLFMFPDGAGSATSYSAWPRISEDVAVVALNCPYLRFPAEMKELPLNQLMDSYLDEVRKRQPVGPYNFGGWSAGGILAYNAAYRLIQEGEQVDSLVLVDSPPPKGLDRLPQRWYDHCKKIDLFGEKMPSGKKTQTPEWLLPHFEGTIDVLEDYYADPLPEGMTPKTTVIWATESVLDGKNARKLEVHPDDPEGMKFLTHKRTDFGGGGWEEFFPGDEINVEKVEGAHHFSMMRDEHAKVVVQMIARAMS